MKIIEYPETRQVFNFDCGANALVSLLVFAGIEEREDRIALLAGTTKDGTDTTGVLRVLNYYGLLCGPPHNNPSVAHSVMWRPARVLRNLWGRCCAGHHIICVLQGSQKLHESWILTPRLLRFAILDLALHKCFGLHLQIDLGIHVGCAERYMAQPGSNGVDVYPGSEQMGCGGVANRVGTHTFLSHRRQ